MMRVPRCYGVAKLNLSLRVRYLDTTFFALASFLEHQTLARHWKEVYSVMVVRVHLNKSK